MTDSQRELIATRGAQMFPRLTDDELSRLSRFGEPRSYRAGEMISRIGETGPGLMLILSGEAEVTQNDRGEHQTHIVTHERGNFMGELAQLSGRPVLVDTKALTDVEGIAISPERLRALLIAEAELGERIMRSLILRRMGLIEAGAGPIIIGNEADGNVLRLVNFLRRNGHPYQRLDPVEDNCARTLVSRFEVADEELPIVLCPERQIAPEPGRGSARPLHRPGRPDRSRQALRPGGDRRGAVGPCDIGLCGIGRPVGADHRLPLLRRAGRSIRANRELPRLPDRHFRHGADGPRLQPGAEVRRRTRHSRRSREARMRERSLPPASCQWRAHPGPLRRHRHRCAIPAPRRRPPRRIRRVIGALLGLSAGGRPRRGRKGHPCRRGKQRRTGRGLPRRAGRST